MSDNEFAHSLAIHDIFDDDSAATGSLAFEGLSVRFGGIAALSDITFSVEPNEVVAVVGPNGAGKSTLLDSISGLVSGNARGSIVLGGQELLGQNPVVIAGTGIGRSFQDPPLMEKETVLENVLVGAHRRMGYGMPSQLWRRRAVDAMEGTARARARAVLEFTGIQAFENTGVGQLPYGTRKVVDLARAILSGPSVLLLDEPTSGLDMNEQAVVGSLLRELHETTPVTILIVEHHMDVVRNVADRVVGLQAGKTLAIGTPAEVLDSSDFKAALVGRHDQSGGVTGASAGGEVTP